jgi:hypothetical protein
MPEKIEFPQRADRWSHFWGHRAVVRGKVGKVDSDPAPTNVRLRKDNNPSAPRFSLRGQWKPRCRGPTPR